MRGEDSLLVPGPVYFNENTVFQSGKKVARHGDKALIPERKGGEPLSHHDRGGQGQWRIARMLLGSLPYKNTIVRAIIAA